MKYTSTKSQGYEPKMSGSNTMYYTGDSGSLLGMMQTGGASSASLAGFRRAKQYNKDMERLKALAAQEARKREKASKWGKIGRTLGGFIPGLGGVIGRTVGDYIGTSKGYGGELDVDTTGTVYGQKGFKALSDSSKEFLGDDKSFRLPLGNIKYRSGIAGDVGLRSGQELLEGIKFASNFIMPGAGAAMGASGIGAKPSNPLPMENEGLLGDVEVPEFDSSLNSFGGSSTVSAPLISNPSTSGNILNNSYASDTASPYYDDNLPGQYTFQDGGLIGYQTGGYTASSVLGDIGLNPTDVQLEQFEAFDPIGIDTAKKEASKNLLDMTGGQGLASLGAGFGGKGQRVQTTLDTARKNIEDTTTSALSNYASGIIDQAAKMEAAGNTFKELTAADDPNYDPYLVPTTDTDWNPPTSPAGGDRYVHNGSTYFFMDAGNGLEWVTAETYNDIMDELYAGQSGS